MKQDVRTAKGGAEASGHSVRRLVPPLVCACTRLDVYAARPNHDVATTWCRYAAQVSDTRPKRRRFGRRRLGRRRFGRRLLETQALNRAYRAYLTSIGFI